MALSPKRAIAPMTTGPPAQGAESRWDRSLAEISQMDLHPCNEFGDAERFANVIDCAELQTSNDVFFAGHAADHENRGRHVFILETLKDFGSQQPGNQMIEQDDVEGVVAREEKGIHTVAGDGYITTGGA